MPKIGKEYFIWEFVSLLKDLGPCLDQKQVETVFKDYSYLDQTTKIFILYAGVGECYTPSNYTLDVEDEYILALGRFLNSESRCLPPDPEEVIHAFRERMAAEA